MQSIDLERLAPFLGLKFLSEGDEHCTQGWIQFQCPYCGDSQFHLGWNLDRGYFNCWACGGRPLWQTLSLLSGMTVQKVRETAKPFAGRGKNREVFAKTALSRVFSLPEGSVPLLPKHKRYLERRSMDPDLIERTWEIKGTNHLSARPWRIVIPIFLGHRIVSYILRTLKDDEDQRYYRCPKDQEIYPSKSLLYGQHLLSGNRAVIVEGPFDAWRLGPGAVAIMGLGYTSDQIELLSKMDQVFILFDSDRPGKIRAKKIAKMLCSITEVEILTLDEGDPASMKQKEADSLMSELGFRPKYVKKTYTRGSLL